MNKQERKEAIEAIRAYVKRYPSQNRAAASLKGVSPGTLSAILNGKLDNVSDDMLRNLVAQVSNPTSQGWQLVDTTACQEIMMALNDAQEYTKMRWITGDAGCGKSTTAAMYAADNDNVFVILCDEDMRKADFMRELARKVGIRTAGMRVRELLEAVEERLTQLESPLLIFDEGDKLQDPIFKYFITLYNHLEGKCGIAFLSTDYIVRRIDRGIKKPGYRELYSRLERKFFELEPTSAIDVHAICQANGLTDRRQIANVIEAAQREDFDLRCVKGAIHREKRLAQAAEE